MSVTCKELTKWINDYRNDCIKHGYSVHGRKWTGKYIYGHAPYNNASDCYHTWLTWVDNNKNRLRTLSTFEDILDELKRNVIKGIGPLTLYDTATMLAFPEGKFPKYVYLHAGTAKGAKALGVTSATIVKNGCVCKNVFVAICSAFNLLSEAEIEDFLCVYSAYLCQDQSKIQKIEARKKRFCNNPKRKPVCL